MLLKAYKYRLYPNQKQISQLKHAFGCCRFVYNWALSFKTDRYQKFQQNVNRFELSRMLTFFKTTEERKFLNNINSQSLQAELRHLEVAFTNFFKHNSKYPRFKKRNSKQSFECPQHVKINFEEKLINIPKLGNVKYRDKHEFTGKIKTCTVSLKNEKYFISILVENEKSLPEKKSVKEKTSVGLDLGLINFVTLSNGNKISNPRFIKLFENKIKHQQRKLSKKVKFSKNWIKQKKKINKLHGKLVDIRNDFLHKLSTNIIKNHDTIFVEDLNISGMLKNHKLSKSISNASWSEFIRQLEYKSEWNGKNVIKIGRFDPSSKLCSCGYLNNELKMSDRNWICSKCKINNDRDILASENIKRFGLMKLNYTTIENNTGLGRAGVSVEGIAIANPVKQKTLVLKKRTFGKLSQRVCQLKICIV